MERPGRTGFMELQVLIITVSRMYPRSGKRRVKDKITVEESKTLKASRRE